MTGPRVRDLLERKGDPLQLEALTGDVGLDRLITTPEASSPGLVLAGYTKRFAAHRIHILGETEITYLDSLGAAERRKALETFFQFDLPCVVISKGQEPPPELLDLARAKGVPVIAFLGKGGGELAKLVDQALIIASSETSHIQEIHLALEHLIVELVEEELCGR